MPDIEKILEACSLITRIAKLIVDFPGDVVVNIRTESARTIFEISANSADIGKLIGTNGRMADAIRGVASAMGKQAHHGYGISIVQQGRSG
jgi:predicted RNA-binding protein YlqC (UPF0109 family)